MKIFCGRVNLMLNTTFGPLASSCVSTLPLPRLLRSTCWLPWRFLMIMKIGRSNTWTAGPVESRIVVVGVLEEPEELYELYEDPYEDPYP